MGRRITLIVGIVIGILAVLSFTEMASTTEVQQSWQVPSTIAHQKKSPGNLEPVKVGTRFWRFLEGSRDRQLIKEKR